MTHASVTIQVAPQSLPSTPCWMGEVAAFAQVLSHAGLLTTIQTHVQFARARFGTYDTIDFVVVLFGYALSGERTLNAFYERLSPFADVFMALFGRHRLPDRSTLSRFLSALDQATVEALRTQFQEDLVARTPFASVGGLWDRCAEPYVVVDVDGTRQAARQRALPIGVSPRWRLRVTKDAREEKSCAPVPRFCKHIPINSWGRLGDRAMGTTGENSNALSR